MKKAIYHYNPKLHSFLLQEYEHLYKHSDGNIVDVIRKEHSIDKNIFMVNDKSYTYPVTLRAYESELEFIND